MKTKILVALKTKYKTFGFSEKAFDGVADYLSKTVTEDTQVETAIGGVKELLKAFQGDVDFVRNEKSDLQKQYDDLKKKTKPDGKEDDPTQAEIIAKAVADAMKPFADKLTGFETQSATEKRTAEIIAKAKEYGIPDFLTNKLSISADADLDAFFKDTKQGLVDQGFKDTLAPEDGAGTPKNGSDLASLIDTGTKQIVESKK